MNLVVLAAAYVTLVQVPPPAEPPRSAMAESVVAASPADRSAAPLRAALNTLQARDAMARVAYAEAGNQGESGLAGVVYTILNRLIDGRWGSTVEAVVDAPRQFEPVMRAGGTWRRLPPVTPVQEATVHTIVQLALQGRLPDLTGGARFFQNQQIVAARAAAGLVPQSLVGFGGAAPSARIGDHTFYQAPGRPSAAPPRRGRLPRHSTKAAGGAIFFGQTGAAATAPEQ